MAPSPRIRIAPGTEGIERLEAHLHGQAFSPHRHDTYAIGITLAGVQRFRYRGTQQQCLPGQCHVLHPDELHDGGAGTDDGFGYRILYVDPSLVQRALQGRPLPFVAQPVLDAARLRALGTGLATARELWDFDAAIDDEVLRTEFAVAVAQLLANAATGCAAATGPLELAGLARVREHIAATPTERPEMATLERLAGLDRWSLARQFRAAFGTSPSRFRTLRQLDAVRRLLRRGSSLADAADAAGFADQSHMSRQFKQAYGLTPARWSAALG